MKILIVDDEQDILYMLSNAIGRKFAVEIITAENCSDAQEKIAKFQPDLALLDLNLPDGDGFELVPILKKKNQLQNSPSLRHTIKCRNKQNLKNSGLSK